MADYDLAEAFEAIEDELIASMMRNFKNHRAEETALGINWTQWQVEQLNALEIYRRNNQKKFSKEFETLNGRISQLIRDNYLDGETEQERTILQAIQNGYKTSTVPVFAGEVKTTGEFFEVNDRKLEALITATTHDMEKAETAVLRLANDQYRKAIFNAQVYANAGGIGYKKAVDMAVKDMLNAGLNCVEYKNGARHTLEDYASMAIRTATTRAYLQGEGAKRKEWGISTVILNKRSCLCPKCLPFVGKVFIDDVWSGGTAEEAKEKGYPLLSTAIDQGLYHPNCKDIHTTYFEGISTPPEKSTAEEKQKAVDQYNQEQKARYNAQQAKKCERISEYSLDEENKRIYKARAEQWRDKEKSLKAVAKSGESGIIRTGGKITDKNFTQIEKFEQQAKQFYSARIRNGDEDVKLISKNTGFSYNDILNIKNYIMIYEHLFSDGSIRKFDPNIDQALAWQRLMENNFMDSDILFLNHELRELKYMQDTNCDYETAHKYATQKYDWQSVIDEIVDNDNINPNLLK